MGRYFNPGNGNFQEHLDEDIYVDKTGMIEYINGRLHKTKKYICVSRPRRFGKSYAADMLVAYYGRGCDSHVQFDGYKISECSDYETHINKYNVIHVDVSGYISSCPKGDTISQVMDRLYSKLTSEIEEEYPDIVPGADDTFTDYLSTVYKKTDIPFVFILDEWDDIFRDKKDDVEEQKEYLDRLKALFKGNRYVALVYMTGILPIKKYGKHSALNMFTEISMTNASHLREYMGFTKEEVMYLCGKYNKPFKKVKSWYDGYTVNGIQIYNPNSVICAMQSPDNDFEGYWTDTETYDALDVYIKTNTYGVQDVLAGLIERKSVKVDISGFANDMVTFDGCDDVLTLLIHLGYLTYNRRSKVVKIPNREIREQFQTSVKRIGFGSYDETKIDSETVFEATLKGDEKKVASYVQKIHQRRTAVRDYHLELSLKCAIQFAYLAAENYYNVYLELPAGDGFADVGFIPQNMKNPAYPPIVVELKIDKTAEGAIGQIEEKEYYNFVPSYHGEVILVGINYDEKTKEHTCQIRRAVK